jgi:hypothetical protein
MDQASLTGRVPQRYRDGANARLGGRRRWVPALDAVAWVSSATALAPEIEVGARQADSACEATWKTDPRGDLETDPLTTATREREIKPYAKGILNDPA